MQSRCHYEKSRFISFDLIWFNLVNTCEYCRKPVSFDINWVQETRSNALIKTSAIADSICCLAVVFHFFFVILPLHIYAHTSACTHFTWILGRQNSTEWEEREKTVCTSCKMCMWLCECICCWRIVWNQRGENNILMLRCFTLKIGFFAVSCYSITFMALIWKEIQ